MPINYDVDYPKLQKRCWEAEAERDRLRAEVATLQDRHQRVLISANEVREERDRLRELLREWDSLIKYQYSGSREAMSAMTAVAQKTLAVLKEVS